MQMTAVQEDAISMERIWEEVMQEEGVILPKEVQEEMEEPEKWVMQESREVV